MCLIKIASMISCNPLNTKLLKNNVRKARISKIFHKKITPGDGGDFSILI